MNKALLIILLLSFVTEGTSQFFTPAQITNIQNNKIAAEGDLYLDTINENYYIGLSNGELSRLGTDSVKVSEIFFNLIDTINGSIFPIYAEEASSLTVGAFEWAYGNGDESPSNFGIVLPIDCELFAVSLNVRTGSGNVEVYRNGIATGILSGSASPVALNNGFGSMSFSAGDIVNFRTIAASGAFEGGKVAAWFKVPSPSNIIRLYGGTVPPNTLGSDGDEYLNTSNGDLYTKISGVWVFQTNLRGISGASSIRSYIQVTNTVSGSINTATQTTFNWINTNATTHITNDAPNFTVATDGITINKTATYKVTIYQYQITTIARSNATVRIRQNGTIIDGFGANAYIRSADGHNEGTASLSRIVSITAGDKIGIENFRQARTGTVTCPANSLIFIIEEM